MKKIIYALMLVLGMSVLFSCEKAESGSSSIVGTWEAISASSSLPDAEIADNFYLQFKEDGSCVSVAFYSDANSPEIGKGTWNLSGNALTIFGDSVFPEVYTVVNLTKSQLTISFFGEIAVFTLKRVSDSVIEKYL